MADRRASSFPSVMPGKARNSFARSRFSIVTSLDFGSCAVIRTRLIHGPKIVLPTATRCRRDFRSHEAHGLFRLQRHHATGSAGARGDAAIFRGGVWES